VKICLIQHLQLASLYCERCDIQLPVTTVKEHVEESHLVFEGKGFWLGLRTQLEDGLGTHGWKWATLADMGNISSWEQQINTDNTPIVSVHVFGVLLGQL